MKHVVALEESGPTMMSRGIQVIKRFVLKYIQKDCMEGVKRVGESPINGMVHLFIDQIGPDFN